jgi:hypothetical protein
MKLTEDEKRIKIKMKRLLRNKKFVNELEKELNIHGGKLTIEQAKHHIALAQDFSINEVRMKQNGK